MRRYVVLTAIGVGLLAGCTAKPGAVAVVPPEPAPAAAIAAMPAGTYAGMRIPAVMPDGRYATPNRDLTADGALWHLRAALNVAALACRGPDAAAIVAGYNTMLGQRKAALAAAQAGLAAEFRTGGGDWQDRYDDQMTRLYNFFAQAPGHAAFCDAAAATLADGAAVAPADLPAFAVVRLAALERPFTDVYAAYDRWRAQRAAATRMAMADTAAPAIRTVQAIPVALPAARPRLALDPSVFVDTRAIVTP
ncbi:hypothetical protein LPN01_10910 [Sphingomonas sp. A2-49]|uniref:hypothetical protein n=1 Tax=Sphingomonas sp. A2-49 TaxID=1391375 RepID=UPI0021D1B9AC|nr:hypothetical protein [Sphingomonas sp. A2-49]MCU6454587.1 hypothetical protein [Sphingomonas sp. A2-49]